ESPKDKDYVNLLIQDIKTLFELTKLINGKMRTPKIEALHRIIDWFNNRPDFENLPKLDVDNSSLGSNAWLSGFLEADGHFYSGFNLNSDNVVYSVKSYMRISQRKTYHRESKTNEYTDSYSFIMETIKDFLGVSKIREINRVKTNKLTEHAYSVKTNKKESSQVLIKYLEKFPLFSSKYLDFLSWVNIQALSNS
uniref:LAGLIDADG homing endonuclease n=1 Tax=Cyathus striatus TaxID=68777 RepID=UPI0023F48276